LPQFVDPRVSRAKFDHEVELYYAIEEELIERGWWLVKAEFPKVFVVFGTPKLKPPSVVFGALIDFTNYDLWPPSVRLVNPFTRKPYTFAESPTHLNRIAAPSGGQFGGGIQPLLQAHNPNEIPFVCMPGVREYHEHPGHSGDSWLIHRKTAEGTLFFILEQLYKYGIQPIAGYNADLRIAISGYTQSSVPS
jgi:hypothetical protein